MAQRPRQPPPLLPWKAREYPVLDETRCTGCGLCCELCPTDCLAMAGPLPWLPRPADCLSCSVCALVCPVDALEMRSFADDLG